MTWRRQALYQGAFEEEISKNMGERTILFSNVDLSSVLYGHEQKMFKEIDKFPPNRIRDEDLDTLCDYFEREYKIDVPALDEKSITVDHEDAKIDVKRTPNRFFYDGGPGLVSGTRFKFYVPYSGEKELFKCRPSSFNFNPPHAQVNPNELVLRYTATGQQEATAIRGQFDRELSQIKQWLTCVGTTSKCSIVVFAAKPARALKYARRNLRTIKIWLQVLAFQQDRKCRKGLRSRHSQKLRFAAEIEPRCRQI